jgi:hypothetical protein
LGHTIICKQIRKEENKKNEKKIENFEKKEINTLVEGP